jgi:hypothetical protein
VLVIKGNTLLERLPDVLGLQNNPATVHNITAMIRIASLLSVVADTDTQKNKSQVSKGDRCSVNSQNMGRLIQWVKVVCYTPRGCSILYTAR